MRNSRILLAPLLVTGVFAAARAAAHEHDRERERDDRVVIDRRWQSRKLEEVADALRAAAERSDDKSNRHARGEIREALDRASAALAEVRADLEHAPDAERGHDRDHDHDLPPAPSGPVAMDPAAFSQLLGEIDRANFAKDKVEVVRSAAREGNFSVDEVIAVLKKMSFADDKVEAAAALYPRVVDRPSWFRVYSALDFSSDREKLKRKVGE